MAYIDYFGIAPESIDLVNSDEFRAVLAAHPNLRLVTVEEDDDGEELFVDAVLPLPEDHDVCVAVMDTDYNEGEDFMWVLYDDCNSISDPCPAFIEVLKVMDAYSVKTLQQRLFSPKDRELYPDSEEVLTATFGFETGDYII